MLAGVHRPWTSATGSTDASGRRVGTAAPVGLARRVGIAAPVGLTRRALLGGSAALAAGVLAACTSDPTPVPSDSPSPTADADAQVRVSVADGEAQLIALYDAVLAAHPGLAADLEPLRADAVAATPTPAGPAPTVGSRPQALAALIEAEQQAVAQRTGACEASTAADLARTVALIAASEAGHAEFLRGIT
jgi:hypothetical protein